MNQAIKILVEHRTCIEQNSTVQPTLALEPGKGEWEKTEENIDNLIYFYIWMAYTNGSISDFQTNIKDTT